jgi:RNA polymerase sigma factor (sigma-70 family)
MEYKKRQNLAEQITTEYMKPIYGFALKRTANMQDAEDLTQEICLKLFKTLLIKDDVESVEKFVWTVAHNALANYYRGTFCLLFKPCPLSPSLLATTLLIAQNSHSLLHCEVRSCLL